MPLGYTITEYELTTPSGAEDYSWRDLKSKIWQNLGISAGSEPFSMEIPLKVVQNPRHPPKIPTSNLPSYNLRPQRELEAHIRWLCSPGAVFEMFRSDFYFFDFFAENFSFFENPTSENPKISVTIGFPIVILGRKSSKKPTSDFWESRTTPDHRAYGNAKRWNIGLWEKFLARHPPPPGGGFC